MTIPLRLQRLWLGATAACALIGGVLVALHYHRLGLTLTHYDARGHLVVARRIFDSITPGWQQVGAVWLPLPHLLNALPVQIDAFYRNGASAVAISIVSFALTTAAIAWIIFQITESRLASLAGAAVFALNPNVLYLQATPMSEPLLFGLMTCAVALLLAWCQAGLKSRPTPDSGETGLKSRPTYGSDPTGDSRRAGLQSCHLIGWMFALACLTRYEAWPVTAAALAAAAWARHRGGQEWGPALRQVAVIAVYPLVAVLAFMLYSRVVIGAWLVTSGFFVPDNPAGGHPLAAMAQIFWGARMLSGYGLLAVASVGLGVLAFVGLLNRQRASGLVALSLLCTAALPLFAFVQGHPYRIRYMVPLIVVEAVGAGIAVGIWRRARRPLAVIAFSALAAIVLLELRPLDLKAPMVVEAQWDRPNMAARQHVTDCLRAEYGGERIMASMGSLGHYMQELSVANFNIRDFLHEGNGELWQNALVGPRPFAGWILIEEKSEGGDMLARIVRERPAFLEGFSRLCDGAGTALYRRDSGPGPRSTRTSR